MHRIVSISIRGPCTRAPLRARLLRSRNLTRARQAGTIGGTGALRILKCERVCAIISTNREHFRSLNHLGCEALELIRCRGRARAGRGNRWLDVGSKTIPHGGYLIVKIRSVLTSIVDTLEVATNSRHATIRIRGSNIGRVHGAIRIQWGTQTRSRATAIRRYGCHGGSILCRIVHRAPQIVQALRTMRSCC